MSHLAEHHVRLVIRASTERKICCLMFWHWGLLALTLDSIWMQTTVIKNKSASFKCISQGCCSFLWFGNVWESGNERLVSIVHEPVLFSNGHVAIVTQNMPKHFRALHVLNRSKLPVTSCRHFLKETFALALHPSNERNAETAGQPWERLESRAGHHWLETHRSSSPKSAYGSHAQFKHISPNTGFPWVSLM